MTETHNRILATHVGSLVRPPELTAYLRPIEDGVKVDEAAFDACLQDAVTDVVKRQADAGIDIVDDGEFGKLHSWSFYIEDRLTGIEQRPMEASLPARNLGKDARLFPEFYQEYFPTQGFKLRDDPVCTGPITYKSHAEIDKTIAMLKRALAGVSVADAFVPVVAPGSAMPRHVNEYYEDDEAFMLALAEAIREEYKAIIDAGLLLQVDDAFLPYMYDMAYADRGVDEYRRWAAKQIEILNHALRDIPEEKIRYHICWGSFNTPHLGDVPAREIIDLVLDVKAGAYLIEMANPRHEHEWRLWEEVPLPDGKTLIPGVVSHATNVVEHPELVAERLVRLADLVGRENVMAGTDCGFAQGPFVQRVHPTIQWAKLEALAEGARLASERLWRG